MRNNHIKIIEARYYSQLPFDKVQCKLCPHNCIIELEKTAICKSRKNIGGKLFATNYGETVTLSIDPIEKKPLYHFYPNSKILSVGANSCNFSCQFCQNYTISQNEVKTESITPQILSELCKKYNLNSVAFTYTEPFTWFEFILDSAKYLKQQNIKVVLVTNGYINPAPLAELLPYIDALNIDLKSLDDAFYRKYCGGSLQPVLDTIKYSFKHCHLEITNLIIPTLNDDQILIQKLIDFIAEIDNQIPLHFSGYFPNYKLKLPPTTISTLLKAKEFATMKLSNVYLGNVRAENSSYCPNCGKEIINRTENICFLSNNRCKFCDNYIYGKFNEKSD